MGHLAPYKVCSLPWALGPSRCPPMANRWPQRSAVSRDERTEGQLFGDAKQREAKTPGPFPSSWVVLLICLPGIQFDKYDDIPVETTGTSHRSCPVFPYTFRMRAFWGGEKGNDVPPGVERFADLELAGVLKDNVALAGYDKPTPVQKHAVPIALAGRDLMACAQTGTCAPFLVFFFPRSVLHPPFVLRMSSQGLARPLRSYCPCSTF